VSFDSVRVQFRYEVVPVWWGELRKSPRFDAVVKWLKYKHFFLRCSGQSHAKADGWNTHNIFLGLCKSPHRDWRNNASTTFGYDAFGNRVLQTTATSTIIYPSKFFTIASSTGSGAKYSTTTEYVFNGDTLLSTVDQQFASGNATGSAQTRYIHPDHLGSTSVVTDASGTVVQTLDYYPYGALRINSSVGGADSGRKYVDRFADQSTLDYLNARYYDSARGQFISEDPTFWALKMNLSDPQSLNSYSYANDNPITKQDADGLAATVAQQIAVLQAQVRMSGSCWRGKRSP
jgi:RHS repeat-associated protein